MQGLNQTFQLTSARASNWVLTTFPTTLTGFQA